MEFEISHPRRHAIPIAPASDADAREWAAQTSRAYAAEAGASEAFASRIERALTDLAPLAADGAVLMLLISAEGHVLAPLRLSASDETLSREGQAEILWSPSALLPPTPAETKTAHLGTGFSSTLLQEEGGVMFATRRWVFPGEDAAVSAMLGPVAPPALAVVEAIAEQVLASTRVRGFQPVEDRARLDALHAAAQRSGEAWAL